MTTTDEPPSPEGESSSTSEPYSGGLIHSISGAFRGLFPKRSEESLKQVIEDALEEHEDVAAAISDEERSLLANILDFGELSVGDIMTPRGDIVGVDAESTLEEIRQLAVKDQHTRMPIYEENLDHVKGFVHIKDLLAFLGEDNGFSLAKVTRDILFVPPSMLVVDLLVKMRLESCHMAIVIDEYGGTDGLVTMEDLFEELVGEIQDEHDDEEEVLIREVSDGVIEADARVPIEELEERLEVTLGGSNDEEEFDTLGGLIFDHLGRVPARGEVITVAKGVDCQIMVADPRRIHKVRIALPAKSA